MLPFWREWATLATQHPSQAEREPEAKGDLVELAPGHPVDVPLYWPQ